MSGRLPIWCAIFTMAALLTACSGEQKLVSGGKSEYRIFVASDAPEPEHQAALELQKNMEKISRSRLEITSEAGDSDKLVYVGFRGAPAALLDGIDTASFGKEEFLIRSDGQRMVIAGGQPRGTMYGVISYLTDHLGCRWYTREIAKIPSRPTITLGKIDDRQKPAFENREPFYTEAYDTQWALHNRTNSRAIPDSLGGAFETFPFVHTFYALVPPEKHFHSHPEYFAQVGGKRVGKNAQLCLTNPATVREATKTVFEWIKTHPKADVFSIDQNDGAGRCECDRCKALDDQEGSPSATLLTFVNQIADTVAKVYPKVQLQTLAYDYTEMPPKTIKPAGNVMIRLCHYVYCSAHPLGTCDNHKPYIDRLDAWRKIAKKVTVWDYYTQFASFLMPFPNFETVKHDVKFYRDRGVSGLFAQGARVPQNGHGEFTELRAWVFAQLMWNPDQDGQKLIDEYVQNVYGEAAGYIMEYIRLLHEQVKPANAYFSIWTDPEDTGYLTLPVIHQADSLFTLAKNVAKKDTALFRRVENAYLPVIYTKLYFYSIGGTAWVKDLDKEVADFKRIVADNRITSMAEIDSVGSIPAFLDRVTSKDHFITTWQVIGPFDYTNRNADNVYPPEKEIDPGKSYTGKNGAVVKWKQYSDQTSGYVDFAKTFAPNSDAVSYAYTTVNLPEARTVTFGVGSNDGIRVWINGRKVLDRPILRRAVPGADVIRVPMQKGENKILLKVDQMGNKWGFYFAQKNK